MKYAIPLGAVFLIGIGVCLHKAPTVADKQGRQAAVVLGIVAQEDALLKMERSSSLKEEDRATAVLHRMEPARSAVNSVRGPVPSYRRIKILLEPALGLTEVQRFEVEAILRRREDQIRDRHDAIRRSGVLDFRSYEWQTNLWKADWFREIDALLDSVQHQRFVILVEQGVFNEGLAFTLEPGMTVLE